MRAYKNTIIEVNSFREANWHIDFMKNVRHFKKYNLDFDLERKPRYILTFKEVY